MSDRALVVGSGLAGLAAACELLEKGCNVTILERGANLGGNSSKATCGIAAPGSAMQQAAGIRDNGQDLMDTAVAADMVTKGPKDVEWLAAALGINNELTMCVAPGHGNVPRTVGTKTHFPGAVVTYAAIHLLQQIASVKPNRLQILYSARVTQLLTDQNKRVVGVAYTQDDKQNTLQGVVILATGGFAGDADMLKRYAPAVAGLATTNDERASGDGLRLGASVNAGMLGLDQVKTFPTAAVLPGQENAEFRIVISDQISGAGGRLLDATGKRFVNELANAQDRSDAMSKASGPIRLAISAADAEKVSWLAEFYTNRKIMQKFRNVNALATEMRLPAAALAQAGLGNGEIYAAVVTPAVNSCVGGLAIGMPNQDATAGRVVSATGQPIDGLFAAGEATAGLSARLWSATGVPLLWAIYSGRIAGRAVSRVLPGSKQSEDLRQIVISSLTAPNKVASEEAQSSPVASEKPLEELTKEELIAKVKDFQKGGVVPAADAGPVGVTVEDVKKHKTKEDAWIIVNGKALDVTKWIPLHPGGEQAITAFLGEDASDEWNAIHKPGTVEKYSKEGGPVIDMGPIGTGKAAGAAAGPAVPDGLTLDDVAKHNKESDIWIVVNGKAYDVTKWTQVHPGGVQAITAYAGKDATDEWNMIHKPGTIEKNLFPGSPNGPVDKGPVSGAAVATTQAVVIDDEEPPPDGPGCMPGPIGAIFYLAKAIIVMLLKTVFFTGNLKFKLDGERKGTIRSACFLLTFTIVHVLGNFVGMIKGPTEANGEGHFFDRLLWTGGLGIFNNPVLSVVEEYLALALLLHVAVALKRSWDISMNYCIYTGRWNMLLSGLTVLFFLTVHLTDIRFSSDVKYTMLRPPPYFVSFNGILEGRVFYEVDKNIPLVRVRDIYSKEVELFKRLDKSAFYTVCILIFWAHMLIGWKKLVPADALQIPKDHVKVVTLIGQVAATAIVSMYLSVVWYTYVAEPMYVENVP